MIDRLLALVLVAGAPPTDPEPTAAPPDGVTTPDDAPDPEPEPEPTAVAPAPADTAPPAATPTPTPAAAPTPSAAPTARPARGPFGLVRDDGWVPNAWPTQQPCPLSEVTAPVCVLVRADVFAGYRAQWIGGTPQNEFRLDRAEVGTGLLWKPLRRLEAGATVGVEAIRSAGPQSLTGIDGDSLVVRLLDAYGHAAAHFGPIDLGARAGLVPERWIEQLEKGYDTRGFDALVSDRDRYFDRSDVGLTLTASGWRGLVDVDLEIVNGEGRAQRERNRRKNTTAIVTVRPLQRDLTKGPLVLALHGAFRDGSIGVASATDRRGAAAVTFASPWVYAGFEYVHALGFAGRSDLRGNALGTWVSGRILPRWLGALAKYDRVQQDLSIARSVVHTASFAVFSDVFPHIDRNRRRMRLYAGYQYEGYGDEAQPLPGASAALVTHRVLVQLEVRGLARFAHSEGVP
jgi:hypothetical protein